MPYPNEHSCRLEDPDKYEKFNRLNCEQKHDDKCIDVIYGIKDGESEIQALRYKTDIWDEDDARTHCKSREGMFEPAGDEEDKEKKHMGNEIERRTYELTDIEIRADDGEAPKIIGHAAVFNKLSVDLLGFREKVAPGAFAKSIEKDDIRALWNHNPDYILGRKKSGTLQLSEDNKGLAIEVQPPDAQWARDLMESIKRGDVDQMSFAFMPIKDSWEEGKETIRTLLEVQLFDVSPVTFPAYPQTDVKIRSVFTEAGIDYEALTSILLRSQKGISLTDADKDLITASINVLNGYLQDNAEPVSEGAPDAGYVRWLGKLRRYLDLAEVT